MDIKLELIMLPVTDVDRVKKFYVEQMGFHEDVDQTPHPGLRFVQLTPPGSACSIAFGEGLTQMPPGSQRGLQAVVKDVRALREQLIKKGVDVTEVDDTPWGSFAFLKDPDGNAWALQQLVPRDKK